jgi:FkbM family methyltransferase
MLTITNDEFNKLFDNKTNIFFIQIGANDGVTVDPIQNLVKNNKWKGLLFEPGVEAFNDLKKNYAEVDDLIFVNSAVSNFDGRGKLFCGTTTPHFTLNQNKAIDMFDVSPNEIEVSIISPKSIIENYNIKNIDLLQIDVEGHDFTILQAFPFELIKPSVIRFEYINLSYDNANIDIVDSFLSKNGYDSFICYECGDIVSILKDSINFNLNSVSEIETHNEIIIDDLTLKKTNKIRIHRYENEMWGRAHLPFFKKFDVYLNKFFNVEIINYNKDNNTFNGSIELLNNVSSFGKNPPITDVDYVIENLATGELKVLSLTEYFNSYISHIAKSDICSTILLAHFNWSNIYYWMKREYAINHLHKIKPWIFLPFQEFDYKHYRNERNKIETYNDKLFWLGSGVDDYRKMIRIIDNKGYMQPIQNTSHNDYLDKLIRSKIGLSYYLDLNKYNTPYDHPGEFCYRDIEYIILGLPFIRIEFKDTTHNPLLPNHHYISIPREHAYVAYSKNGDEGVADLYIERYNEVVNDSSFLEYISKNQIKWANENLLDGNAEKLTFELLNLNEWLYDDYLENINKIKYESEKRNYFKRY